MRNDNYQKAIQYARKFVGNELAKDLVHDLYLNMFNRNINLFATSKRFMYVALYNYHRSKTFRSMEYRHKVVFTDCDELYQSITPYDILVEKELRKQLTQNLTLKVEGYNVKEIGVITGYSRISAGKQLRKAMESIDAN